LLLFYHPICTYCTFTVISVGNAVVNWFDDRLNVFILNSHHCTLLLIKYLTEQYIIMFTNTGWLSTIWSHVSGCVHRTENVHFSGKKSGACNTFVLVFQCSRLIVLTLFTWMLCRKVTKLFLETFVHVSVRF
jgi:hypothetical protein